MRIQREPARRSVTCRQQRQKITMDRRQRTFMRLRMLLVIGACSYVGNSRKVPVTRPCSESQTYYRRADQGASRADCSFKLARYIGPRGYKSLLSTFVSECNPAVSYHSSFYANRPSGSEYPGGKRGIFSTNNYVLVSFEGTFSSSSPSRIQVTRLCSVHENLVPRAVLDIKPATIIYVRRRMSGTVLYIWSGPFRIFRRYFHLFPTHSLHVISRSDRGELLVVGWHQLRSRIQLNN